MKCLAVCQNELVMRTLHGVLSPTFDVEFLVESRPLARRLIEEGLKVTVTDCSRCDSYVKVDLTPDRAGPDPVRELWLRHPRLAAVELRLSPREAAIVAVLQAS